MPNPSARIGGGGFSARIFVGLNVGTRKAFDVDDVVDLVWKVRKKQKRTADASILAQKVGGITTETFIELLELPFPDKVRAEARRLAKSKAKYQGIAMQLKEREVKAKELRAQKS